MPGRPQTEDPEDPSTWKKESLQQALHKLGLSVHGDKAVLLDRYQASQRGVALRRIAAAATPPAGASSSAAPAHGDTPGEVSAPTSVASGASAAVSETGGPVPLATPSPAMAVRMREQRPKPSAAERNRARFADHQAGQAVEGGARTPQAVPAKDVVDLALNSQAAGAEPGRFRPSFAHPRARALSRPPGRVPGLPSQLCRVRRRVAGMAVFR